MERIRVLHLAWRLSRGGGAPAVLRNILKGIDRERFEVHVSTVRPHFAEDQIEELGNHIVYHPLNIRGKVTWSQHGRIALALVRMAREIRPDILHAQGAEGWYTMAPGFPNAGIRWKILEIHDAPQTRRALWLKRLTGQWIVHRLGYQPLVHSTSTRDGVAQAYKVSADSISVIPRGVDTTRFASAKVSGTHWRQRFGLPHDALVVLYVARLVSTKNVGLYLDVAREVVKESDRCFFLVVGDGPLRGALEGRVKRDELEHRIRFLGFQEDLADAYHASDLFLSTSNYEGFGLAIVEAMVARKPVVATPTAAYGMLSSTVSLDVSAHPVMRLPSPVRFLSFSTTNP